MIELRTPSELREMEAAGRFVADTLTALAAEVSVGDNLLDIDAEAHRRIAEAGAESCYIDYHPSFGASPFGHVICTSVNEGVLHGLPHDRTLADGDLLSLDFAVSVDGWVADSAISVVVGEAAPADLKLIDTTQRALAAGIRAAVLGNRMGDISAAIGKVAKRAGYRTNLEFGGHGVGRTMHGDPHVPNDGKPRHGLVLEAGLVLAIEPWLLATTNRIIREDDGWTLSAADGSRGAHSEHTIAITDEGPLVLTARADGIGIPDNAILPAGVSVTGA
ncbi:type I methionyl aminopeptidase [Naumannella halotolerans]|uniref:Methionine aminopeptidase n=1 Tax=Naumannella halotolerans TaxID=993414 RepID=A0A4R7J6L7_9ACTN|nr:type I methionyl aminopeptidase [Naumannella halotolerans]TDT33041.1 methionyl aminopeptidase [Naumannella halotolerans]